VSTLTVVTGRIVRDEAVLGGRILRAGRGGSGFAGNGFSADMLMSVIISRQSSRALSVPDRDGLCGRGVEIVTLSLLLRVRVLG
jgi:hypothetical protein